MVVAGAVAVAVAVAAMAAAAAGCIRYVNGVHILVAMPSRIPQPQLLFVSLFNFFLILRVHGMGTRRRHGRKLIKQTAMERMSEEKGWE